MASPPTKRVAFSPSASIDVDTESDGESFHSAHEAKDAFEAEKCKACNKYHFYPTLGGYTCLNPQCEPHVVDRCDQQCKYVGDDEFPTAGIATSVQGSASVKASGNLDDDHRGALIAVRRLSMSKPHVYARVSLARLPQVLSANGAGVEVYAPQQLVQALHAWKDNVKPSEIDMEHRGNFMTNQGASGEKHFLTTRPEKPKGRARDAEDTTPVGRKRGRPSTASDGACQAGNKQPSKAKDSNPKAASSSTKRHKCSQCQTTQLAEAFPPTQDKKKVCQECMDELYLKGKMRRDSRSLSPSWSEETRGEVERYMLY